MYRDGKSETNFTTKYLKRISTAIFGRLLLKKYLFLHLWDQVQDDTPLLSNFNFHKYLGYIGFSFRL